MITLGLLKNAFGDHITRCQCLQNGYDVPYAYVRFWLPDEPVSEDTIYIYSEVKLPEHFVDGITVICTADVMDNWDMCAEQENCNLIFTDMSLPILHNALHEFLERSFSSGGDACLDNSQQTVGNPELARVICQLLDEIPCSNDVCLQARQAIPVVRYGENFRVIVLSAGDRENSHVPTVSQILKVKQILGLCEAVRYKSTVLFLTAATPPASLSEELIVELQMFVSEQGLFFGIGGITKYLSAMPTMYRQCLAAIRLGQKLLPDRKGVFDYYPLSIYHYIEMCTSDRFQDFHRNHMYYYCHPAAALQKLPEKCLCTVIRLSIKSKLSKPRKLGSQFSPLSPS